MLEHGSSKVDHTPKRKKPWEKPEDDSAVGLDTTAVSTSASAAVGSDKDGGGEGPKAETDRIDVNGHRETGQGVVNILRPNAVPDSGLLAKE